MAIAGTPREMGALSRSMRKERGLSQRELAALAGCSQRFVSEFERGKPTAEIGKAFDVLEALGLRIDVFPARPAAGGREAVERLVERAEARIARKGGAAPSLSDFLEQL